MKTLYHLYAVNRDGFRVTPKQVETDRARAERVLSERNQLSECGFTHAASSSRAQRWVALEVDRTSGRLVSELNLVST